ncbi:pentatricopeptide repeat-containing protein At1g02370, mitochondrial isoform X1 [Carica papaya]|uniref:pentatricopeptide repeat-containing protein At1g02370, mitochondrial isoform X1 n=1 Tax=Carica papaya TaxID=3649 RepID=UPI000B8CBE73|nr:pentatricopeptide repeat-containing protein At1g02370, mitochondrial isoform X1 [Carica papaya]
MIRGRLISSASWLVRRLCTASVEAAPAAESSRRHGKLYRKLSALGATGGTVAQVLDQHIMEGGTVRKDELSRIIKELRKFRRHQHALEIMDWMERRKMNFSHPDQATRLDLIAKTKGITAAENYFSGLSPAAKNQFTYGALLNCYCTEVMTDKALAHFEKMDELNFVSGSLPFTNLMCLYMKLGKPEEVPRLVDEMKRRKIPLSTFSYSIWLQSLGSLDDIEGVEEVLEEMAKDGEDKSTWNTYANLAAIYAKAGQIEKAKLALKSLEEKMKKRNREPYHYLLSIYAGISNPAEVNRVWNSLKTAIPGVNNMSYLVMLQALDKLNDVSGLKKCFEEWESNCSHYDMRLANVTIRNYLSADMHSEAISVFANARKRSSGPFLKAHEMLVIFYLKNQQPHLALKHWEEAISGEDKNWSWSSELVSAFFKYFREGKDVDGAEEFCRGLKQFDCLDSNAYSLLLRTYIAAGRSAPEMQRRLEQDNIEINQELEELLANVSSIFR